MTQCPRGEGHTCMALRVQTLQVTFLSHSDARRQGAWRRVDQSSLGLPGHTAARSHEVASHGGEAVNSNIMERLRRLAN
jgi:hypothetical protein